MVPRPEEPYRPKLPPPHVVEAGWQQEFVSSTAPDQDRLVSAVVSAMAALGYAERERFGMRLALEEALVNAMRHGHQGDPRKLIRVCYRVTAERVLAEVEDQGPGFDPAHVPDPRAPERLTEPGGRGLLLMRAYMTSVCYTGIGNCVVLLLERAGAG